MSVSRKEKDVSDLLEEMKNLGLWPRQLANLSSKQLLQYLNFDYTLIDEYIRAPDFLSFNSTADFFKDLFDEYKSQTTQAEPRPSNKKQYTPDSSHFAYLGPGIGSWLNEWEVDEESLKHNKIPVIHDAEELSEFLGPPINQLMYFMYQRKGSRINHYIEFDIAKKAGGSRPIAMPKKDLMALQYRIKDEILDKLTYEKNIYGFVKKRNAFDNATYHRAARVIIRVDIHDFFTATTFDMVRKAFSTLGYSGEIATALALLCTKQPSREVRIGSKTYHAYDNIRYLPQGSPTSPSLANLVLKRVDAQLVKRSKPIGFKYSRYADDLCFSSRRKRPDVAAMLRIAYLTLEMHGFTPNKNKTKIMRSFNQQQVTGFVVNSNKALVPRVWRKRLRAMIHRYKLDHDETLLPIILGSLEYLRFSHPDLVDKYLAELSV